MCERARANHRQQMRKREGKQHPLSPARHLRGQCASVEGEAAALFIDLHVPPGSIGAVPLLTQRLLPRSPP